MIRIELDEASLGATRIAISPLWEAFCIMYLAGPARVPSWPYGEWVVRAREVLRDDERTRPLRLLTHGPYSFPDFLLPGCPAGRCRLRRRRAGHRPGH